MESNLRSLTSSSSLARILLLSLFLLVAPSAAAPSNFISDDIFGCHASIGRNLLQAKQACPIAFEFQNYSIITNECRGPQYPANLCCAAFKEFACPFSDQLNDLTNDCASTMFSYINLHGRYPPGLFASECREGKNGLECPASPPTESENSDASGSQTVSNTAPPLMLAAAFLVLFLRLF